MRKRLISIRREDDSEVSRAWLDLTETARVEVTSEADGYPVEGALLGDQQRGWRADAPGPQLIRLLFDEPQSIRTIRLVFKEEQDARTQEFLLRWLPDGATSWKEIVRQQWNFSPPQSVEEREEYEVNLDSAVALELSINPDISQRTLRASLERLQLSLRAGY